MVANTGDRGAALILSLTLLSLTSGCFLLSPAKPAGDKGAVIKVGLLVPISGTSAQLGVSVAEGAQLAIDQINLAGGVLGSKLALVKADDQSDPKKAAEKAGELIDQGVVAILGTVNSPATKAALIEQAKPKGVVMISPGSTSPDFSDPAKVDSGGWFFRTVASDEAQGRVLAKLAIESGYKNLGIIHVNNIYGQGFATVIKRTFEAEPGHQVFLGTYSEEPLPKPSYSDVVSAMLVNNVDAVAMIGLPGGGAQIYKDWILGGQKPELPWLFSQALRLESFTNNVNNPQRLEGMRGTYPNLSGPLFDRFAAEYKVRWGAIPGTLYATTAYDATLLLALALQKGGVATREAVKDNLRAVCGPEGTAVSGGVDGIKQAFAAIQSGQAINYQGASGPVDLDAKGDIATASYVIWKVTGGKIENTTQILSP